MNTRACVVRATAVLLLAAGVAPCAGPPAGGGPTDAAPAKEVARLQGDWVMVEYGSNKYKKGETDQNHFNLYVQKDRAIFHFDGTDPDDEIVTTFTTDPSKAPKEIDFVAVKSTISGYKKGTRTLGIYKLDGDTLTLCTAGEGRKTRPTDFATAPGKEVYSYKFVRSKTPLSGNSTRVNERP